MEKNKVVPMYQINFDDVKVNIEHGAETMSKVHEISSFLKELPLTNSDNDRLVELMKDMLLIAEHETYIKGFGDGISFMCDVN